MVRSLSTSTAADPMIRRGFAFPPPALVATCAADTGPGLAASLRTWRSFLIVGGIFRRRCIDTASICDARAQRPRGRSYRAGQSGGCAVQRSDASTQQGRRLDG
jgi:hypothetical protein